MRRRRPPRSERGFVLIAVLLVVVLMVATVVVTLREASDGLRAARLSRSRELVSAAVEHGVNRAMDRIQRMDPADLLQGDWDIFDTATPPPGFVTDADRPLPYPPDGPDAGALEVRVGLRPGQRTRAPVGEDVRDTYGHIVEIQISVRAAGFGDGAEERVAVGVRVPHVSSHAN
jgi:type II secretory pathway pseudopilin PulG